MNMPPIHKPTLGTAVVLIVVALVVYHFAFKNK